MDALGKMPDAHIRKVGWLSRAFRADDVEHCAHRHQRPIAAPYRAVRIRKGGPDPVNRSDRLYPVSQTGSAEKACRHTHGRDRAIGRVADINGETQGHICKRGKHAAMRRTDIVHVLWQDPAANNRCPLPVLQIVRPRMVKKTAAEICRSKAFRNLLAVIGHTLICSSGQRRWSAICSVYRENGVTCFPDSWQK